MYRYHAELARTEREWNKHLAVHRRSLEAAGKTLADLTCVCDVQKGRFRKQDAHDCGKAQCQCCHFEKLYAIPSAQQRRADTSYHEQLHELSRGV